MKLLITGATGFVGRALVKEALRRGHEVTLLSRDPARAKDLLGPVPAYRWEPQAGPPPAEALQGIDTVIHLAGEAVGRGRWTRKRMALIRDSRIAGTRNLVEVFATARPRAFVCASASGWYGDRGDDVLTEKEPPGRDFLADLCRDWEAEAARARDRGVRWVSIRTGIVLGREGGLLQGILPAFRKNLGGPLAGGKQWMPWIHLEDLVGLYLFAAGNDRLSGPVNGAAPNPVTNHEFTGTLGRILDKWTFMPMPRWLLRIAMGKLARHATDSARCVPEAALKAGFEFKHPTLEGALRQILS